MKLYTSGAQITTESWMNTYPLTVPPSRTSAMRYWTESTAKNVTSSSELGVWNGT